MDTKSTTTNECNREGKCILRSNEPYVWYRIENCPYNCLPIACSNYEVCKKASPQWILDTKGGLCSDCETQFEVKLSVDNGDEGDGCYTCRRENKRTVTTPGCGHRFCVDCFPVAAELTIPQKDSRILHNKNVGNPLEKTNTFSTFTIRRPCPACSDNYDKGFSKVIDFTMTATLQSGVKIWSNDNRRSCPDIYTD